MNRKFLLLLSLLGLAASVCVAQEKTAPVSDRIVAGGSVRQTVPIEGDLFGFGGDFELLAPVKGDAMIAGGNVRLRGPIGGELMAAGGNVVLASVVARDVVIAGGNVEIAKEATVEGDLTTAGGDVDVRGSVKGSVHVGAGNVLIDSEVGGDVHAASGDLKLGPNARIAGRVVHRGANVSRDPAAEVAGGIERALVSSDKRRGFRDRVRSNSGGGWFWTIGVLGLAALLAGAFPEPSKRVAAELRARPGLAFLFGFIVLVCVPIAAVVFMITIIGIPVAIAVLLLYFVLLLVGYAAAGVMLGEAALQRFRAQDAAHVGWRIGAAVLAMLVIALLGRIPFLGGFIVFAALLAGIGAIVITYARPRAPVTA